VRSGELTLDQARQALAERSQSAQESQSGQQFALQAELGRGALDVSRAQEAQAGQQFALQAELGRAGVDAQRQQIANQVTQFAGTQEQQLALAKLADATQNRQIDVSTDLGRNNLLVQLAGILGGPTGASDPNLIKQIASSLGIPYTPPGTKTPWTIDSADAPPAGTSWAEAQAWRQRHPNGATGGTSGGASGGENTDQGLPT